MPERMKQLFIVILVFAIIGSLYTYFKLSADQNELNDALILGRKYPTDKVDSVEDKENSQIHEMRDTRKPVKTPHELKRVVDYCNPSHLPVTGSEDSVGDKKLRRDVTDIGHNGHTPCVSRKHQSLHSLSPAEFKLVQVHVFIRHGERAPMHTIKGYKPPPIRCMFDHTLAGNNKKFHEFLPTMYKYYGTQTKAKRFQNWSLFPEKPLCDGGSLLTGVGALQHLKNGYFLSQKYTNQSTLFDQNKSIIAQVYVRTTEYSRTFQSMIAFMYGFLPEFDLTLLNFEPSDNLRFCSAQKAKIAACTCKAKDRLKSKDNFSHLFHTNNTEYGNIQAELAEIFKVKPSQLPKIGVILDVLMTQLCHRHPLYCNDENKCLSAPLIDALWKLQNAETTAKARYDESYRKTCRLEMHPVLLEIAHRFSDVKQGKKTSKFVLYSGHDLTLSPLLHSLSIFDGKWPGFASRVVIELYSYLQYPNTKKNFYLKFLYNGKDLTEEVIFCRGKTFQGMCKLKFYLDFIFEESLQEFGYDSYEEACR